MTAPLTLRSALCADLPQMRGLLDAYLQELDGRRAEDYPYFDAYWEESGRHPFSFESGPRTVGFAFVRGPASTGTEPNQMAEFYVRPDARRRGLGTQAAREIFRLFPGPWELRAAAQPPAAVLFWKRVLSAPGIADLAIEAERESEAEFRRFRFVSAPTG